MITKLRKGILHREVILAGREWKVTERSAYRYSKGENR